MILTTHQPPTGPVPARTPEARRELLRQIREVEADPAGASLAADIAESCRREAEAREALATATAERVRLEGAQLASSTARERRVARLRQQLAAGAPPELDQLERDLAALIEYGRLKSQTWIGTGFEGLDARRPTTVSTNVQDVAAFLEAAREQLAAVQSERYAEHADVARFAPFAEITIPGGQLERARRTDERAEFVPRSVIVPAALASQFAQLGGIRSPTPLLSPGERRQAAWEAERSARRRWNSGESWR